MSEENKVVVKWEKRDWGERHVCAALDFGPSISFQMDVDRGFGDEPKYYWGTLVWDAASYKSADEPRVEAEDFGKADTEEAAKAAAEAALSTLLAKIGVAIH